MMYADEWIAFLSVWQDQQVMSTLFMGKSRPQLPGDVVLVIVGIASQTTAIYRISGLVHVAFWWGVQVWHKGLHGRRKTQLGRSD